MRSTFFLYLGLVLLSLAGLYFVWLVLKSFYTMFSDMLTGRELDKLAQEYSDRRRQRAVEEHSRLDNGCDHAWGDPLGALPDDVCGKCGLSKFRPSGDCDHVWRIQPGAIPHSRCELCGAEYGSMQKHAGR